MQVSQIATVVGAVFIISFTSRASGDENEVTVGTYNLWNVMFNWEIRKLHIAQMIKDANLDVIGFQEVRASFDDNRNQLGELHKLLPEYKWAVYHAAHTVVPRRNTFVKGWEKEGLGVLSKLPLVTKVQSLGFDAGQDSNRRIALHCDITMSRGRHLHLAIVHLSYDRQQQCRNAIEVYNYIDALPSPAGFIVMGDFNTYSDFEGPVHLLTKGEAGSHGCRVLHKTGPYHTWFTDAWQTVHPGDSGFTFSNMPEPGLESRPDRVLASDDLFIQSAILHGVGESYKLIYQQHIVWQRFENVIQASYDAAHGYKGYSCGHDCGPHASCRCGVCTSGGNANQCDLPDCDECHSAKVLVFIMCIASLLWLSAQLIYAALRILIMLNDRNEYSSWQICLFNPKLYVGLGTTRSRSFISKLFRCCPWLRWPPVCLLVFSITLLYVMFKFTRYSLRDAQDLAEAIIPEEFNPSDHLMLSVKVRLKS